MSTQPSVARAPFRYLHVTMLVVNSFMTGQTIGVNAGTHMG
jgi:hypothetical protein